MTEDQLEQETLGWLAELGYAVHSGYDIAHDGPNPWRSGSRRPTDGPSPTERSCPQTAYPWWAPH